MINQLQHKSRKKSATISSPLPNNAAHTFKAAMRIFSNLFSLLETPIIPPFKGAAILLWTYLVLMFLVDRSDPIWSGSLSDPDNYLYLVQAMDLLKGQNWFDLIQHRMNPPDGTVVHYSRLLSGLYAGATAILWPFISLPKAAFAAALVLPPIFLAFLLFALEMTARTLVHKDWGGLTAYVIFFSGCVLSKFMPGYIDHHGPVILLSTTAFFFIVQTVKNPTDFRMPLTAGACLALGMALSLETIAILIPLTLGMGLWAISQSHKSARSAAVFALTLFAFSAAFLFATQTPTQALTPRIDIYSIPYVLLTAYIAPCFIGIYAVAKKPLALRLTVGGILAAACGYLFLCHFPELLKGPYSGVPDEIARMIFAIAPESWPIVREGISWNKIVFPLLCPTIAIWASLYMIWQTRRLADRWLWGMLAATQTISVLLAAFYQMRLLYFAYTFAALPLAAIACRDWQTTSSPIRLKRLISKARFAFVLIVIPLSALAAGKYDNDYQGTAAKDGKTSAEANCNMATVAQVLNDPFIYGDRSRIIINSINEGPEIIYLTPHKVLAGPYHTNVGGNFDAAHFFSASNPNEAKEIARRRNAELVVFCPSRLEMRIYENPDAPSLARQIVNGHIPVWLKPVQFPTSGNLMLFEIAY